MPQSMFEKIWNQHEVSEGLIYIDLHLVHEVTSPQAFDGLRLAGRRVRRPDRTMATADHNVPTDGATTLAQIKDALSRKQIEVLENNCWSGPPETPCDVPSCAFANLSSYVCHICFSRSSAPSMSVSHDELTGAVSSFA